MDNIAVEIRAAGVEDTKAIQTCMAAAFEPYRAEYSPGAYADTVLNDEGLLHRLQQMHVLVAAIDGKIVGTITGTPKAHLRGMAVLPEWRGSGVAAKLLAAIETRLHAQGCQRITLNTTVPLDRARKFYEKHGYQRSGKVSDFFGMPLIEYVKEL